MTPPISSTPRRLVAMALTAISFSAATAAFFPAPNAAAAQTSQGTVALDAGKCSVSYACLWGNRNYSGDPWWEKKALGRYNTGFSDNDETSSAWNRTNTASLLLYNDTNQSSSNGVVCLPRMYASRDLNEASPEFDDRISSMWLRTGYCSTDYAGIDSIGGKKTNP